MFVVTVTEDKTGEVVSRSQPLPKTQAEKLFNAKCQRVDLEEFSVDLTPAAMEGQLRVWAKRDSGVMGHKAVETPQEGLELINQLAQADLQDDSIEWNTFGLEVVEDDEWCEWQDEEGFEIGQYVIIDGQFMVSPDFKGAIAEVKDATKA